ncbi:hypothetical protein B488_10880 [Liberibacter crescens BT-1]|uniref:Uncharacterized protein n=1 Tax=Liberibacter crescens (strain BT-1) TaxID=1215343 RepID=L0EW67_LIBCB|nr:hypothetical protein B488_10880 [Liberibacter crescens BT-1]
MVCNLDDYKGVLIFILKVKLFRLYKYDNGVLYRKEIF